MSASIETQWTNKECRLLTKLRASGLTHGEISRVLERRTPKAVEFKIRELRLARSETRYGPSRTPAPTCEIIRRTIIKDDLPSYYALGWRVSWFEGNKVGLEWRSSSPVLCPSSASIKSEG